MKIVIAPDSFKESLSAISVASIIKKSFLEVFPTADIITLPLADGGEGTTETLICALGLSQYDVISEDPLGRVITGFYGYDMATGSAYIDIATCSGLPLLLEHERDPVKTTTYGTGILIKDGLERGAKHIYLGLGGSATNDAGIGILRALGVSLTDKNHQEISQGVEHMSEIQHIIVPTELTHLVQEVKFTILSDVQNPLYGKSGASFTFGKQKGANESTIVFLDNQLKIFSDIVQTLGFNTNPTLPGMGAAGGAAFGLSLIFKELDIISGIDLILEKLEAKKHIKDAQLVITAEGKLDDQTLFGKAPAGVANLAKLQNIPVIAFSGILGNETERLHELFDAFFPIVSDITSLEKALKDAEVNLQRTSLNVARLLKLTVNSKG